MIKHLQSIVFICCLLLSTACAFGQYNHERILTDSTFISQEIRGIQEIIVDFPSNGKLRKYDTKPGYFNFTYSPLGGFEGRDTFGLEYRDGANDLVYASYIIDVVPSIIETAKDFIKLPAQSDYIFVDVVANDRCTACPLSLIHAYTADGLYEYILHDSLYVKPKKGFSGFAHITYNVQDTIGNVSNGQLSVLVVDTSIEAGDEFLDLQVAENTSVEFFLKNDKDEILQEPKHGVVEYIYNGNGVQYTPFQNFTGKDTIVVGDGMVITTVLINVIDIPNVNSFVVDDYVITHPNRKVEFDVFKNDIVANSAISYYSKPNYGTLKKLSGGAFAFTPDSTFTGEVSFQYIVCLPGGGKCETGNVTIVVDNLNPDNRTIYNLTTPKNRPFIINYEVALTNFNFTTSVPPSHGSLDIFPGLDTLQISCENIRGHNMVLYTPDSSFVGRDTFEIKYCVNGQCFMVDVFMNVVDKSQDTVCVCVDDCVWPGDMNADGRVNMNDLLALGQNLGLVGEYRPEGSPDWFGQYCPNWNKRYKPYDADIKHIDADGNGTIEAVDTAAISEFFGLKNKLLPSPFRYKQPFPINLEYNGPPEPEIGDLVTFDIIIGSEEYPAYHMDGFVFGLDVDPNVVDTSTIKYVFNHSSFLSYHNSTIDMSVVRGARVDLGTSRTDRRNVTGFGYIGSLSFVIEDEIDGIHSGKSYPLEIVMRDIAYSHGDGEISFIPSFSKKINVDLNKKVTGTQDKGYIVSIFPNPISIEQNCHIRLLGQGVIKGVKVYDISGNQVISESYSNNLKRITEISTSSLSSGVYILQILTNKGVESQKLVVQ